MGDTISGGDWTLKHPKKNYSKTSFQKVPNRVSLKHIIVRRLWGEVIERLQANRHIYRSPPLGFISTRVGPARGEGYSSEFLVGVCRPVPQILTQFQTIIFRFPHPFPDLASKIHTRFQTFVVSQLSFASVTKSRIGKIPLK